MIPLMICRIQLLKTGFTLCEISVTPGLNVGNPLVEDSIRLIGGISTFIGATLLADSNDRCTA
jgi:hypothetical protein